MITLVSVEYIHFFVRQLDSLNKLTSITKGTSVHMGTGELVQHLQIIAFCASHKGLTVST